MGAEHGKLRLFYFIYLFYFWERPPRALFNLQTRSDTSSSGFIFSGDQRAGPGREQGGIWLPWSSSRGWGRAERAGGTKVTWGRSLMSFEVSWPRAAGGEGAPEEILGGQGQSRAGKCKNILGGFSLILWELFLLSCCFSSFF